MENTQQLQNHSSEEIPEKFNTYRFLSNPVILLFILLLVFISGGVGYLLGKQNQLNSEQAITPSSTPTQIITPPAPSQTAVNPITLPANCTTDNQCPEGYACEALQGQGTACPVSMKTINPDGSVTNNTVISCSPTYTITKGVCKVKKDGICTNENDCLSGLICHDMSTSTVQVKKCEEATLGTCSGNSDTSCPAGYQCTEGCGPPIIREGENNLIPWNCTAKELVGKPRACPICLASNTMIATTQGEVNVRNITIGMEVWSVNKNGEKIAVKIIKIGSSVVPSDHKVVHLVLSDGRELWVSPNHPTITGNSVGTLRVGEEYDRAKISQVDVIPYWDTKTYDILPASDTGFYYANDILMGSTLR